MISRSTWLIRKSVAKSAFAIALGNEPIITLMGATPLLYDQLEYRMAAVMQGAPSGWSRLPRAWMFPGLRMRAGGAPCWPDSPRPRGLLVNSPATIQDVTSIG